MNSTRERQGRQPSRRRQQRGRRRRGRGDVRAALLLLLAENATNGYRLMQEIEERSDGLWRPSPGSVYPTLSRLEGDGLVAVEKHDGHKTFSLTKAGDAYVDENRERLGEPWVGLGDSDPESAGAYRREVRPLIEAVKQVGRVGDDDALAAAAELLTQTRRKLYAILAEEPAASRPAKPKPAKSAPAKSAPAKSA